MHPIDIYVVGHHGSDTSSSKELLDFIKPTYALISSVPVGRNQNPDSSVLQRLSDAGTEVYSTYLSGDIKVMFENGMISIDTGFKRS
jgi:competence protein ComEC